MNRTLKIALGAVIGLGLTLPAMAQFPDVPDNHWAYEAVEGLRDAGCLVGYPDGLYRGNRPMSRYEFAAATWACHKKMMSMWEDLDARVKKLEEGRGPGDNSWQDAVKALQADVAAMKGWGKRIEDLEKLSKEFEKELASLGVDVKKMREDIGNLDERVTRLEKIKPAVDLHGTVDFLVLGGHSSDNKIGLTQGNRVFGVDDNGGVAGMTQDLSVFHEVAFTAKGTNEEGPKWEATIVASNLLSDKGSPFTKGGAGNMNANGSGEGFGSGNSDIYVNTANVTFDTALAGQGFSAKIGRVGHQVGPYLWKRTDYTTYYKNERWDNGDFYFDGGILGFNWGNVDLKVFGGVNSAATGINAGELNPMSVLGGSIDRTLGVQLMFPIGEMGGVNLAYLWHEDDQRFDGNPATLVFDPANRLTTFGGDVHLKFDQFTLWGGFAQSNIGENDNTVMDDDNIAWDVRAMYDAGNWGAGAGYREVENNFYAKGSWGRFGNQFSMRNIKGFNGKIWFKPGEDFKIWAKGEFLEPKMTGGVFSNFDKMNSFMVGLDYMFSPNWGAMASYEDVRFDPLAGADTTQRWYTLGFNYGMSANSNLMFTYTFSDVEFGAGTTGAGGLQSGVTSGSFRGGLFGTQLSVKF